MSEYLTEWDGETFYYEILGLLKIVQMTNFKEIYDTLMAPLESFMHKFTISDKVNKILLLQLQLEYFQGFIFCIVDPYTGRGNK